MPGNYVLRKTYVDGDILSASDYVADHQQHIDNQTPEATDDASANVAAMRTTVDHGDVGSESLASTLAGEIQRLRYAIQHIKGVLNNSAVTQWYSKSYSVVPANSSITSAKLANGATYIQALRATASNVAINNATPTTLVQQAITMTRTRLRVAASIGQLAASGTPGTYTITLRLRRDSTVLATKTVSVSVTAAVEDEASRVVFYIDNPGPGTYTYSVTGQTSDVALISTIGEYELLLEEIA
jgi:hypothetical protein